MVEINKWLHSYDFNYSYFLDNYINKIINLYNNNPLKEKDFAFDLDYLPLNNFLLPKLNKIVEENYYVGKRYTEGKISIYIQEPNEKEENHSYLHNHAHTLGNICGVFYLNIPQDGGEFHVYNPPFIDQIIKPQIDKIYLFPNWLMHRAISHKGDKKRICFNWWYGGNIRPIHKLTGQLW